MSETDNGRVECNAAGSAEQERPDFAEEIRSLQTTGLFAPESSEGFAPELPGHRGFGAADGDQESFDVVRDAIDIVFGQTALVSPAIAVFTQFTDETAFDKGQFVAEEFIPVVPHEDQKCLCVPRANGAP